MLTLLFQLACQIFETQPAQEPNRLELTSGAEPGFYRQYLSGKVECQREIVESLFTDFFGPNVGNRKTQDIPNFFGNIRNKYKIESEGRHLVANFRPFGSGQFETVEFTLREPNQNFESQMIALNVIDFAWDASQPDALVGHDLAGNEIQEPRAKDITLFIEPRTQLNEPVVLNGHLTEKTMNSAAYSACLIRRSGLPIDEVVRTLRAQVSDEHKGIWAAEIVRILQRQI